MKTAKDILLENSTVWDDANEEYVDASTKYVIDCMKKYARQVAKAVKNECLYKCGRDQKEFVDQVNVEDFIK